MDFPGVRALDGADFEVRAGEVHALLGENGAGKSTLIKVLTGLYQPTSGTMMVAGRVVRPRSVRDAEAAGISTVYQEVDLIPTMSVAENVCLGREARRLGVIRRSAVRERARAALARLGISIDVGRVLAEFPIAVQQMVAVARALDVEARVLILDEPTSSLDPAETRTLFEVMRRLRAQGLGIVFVTHFLNQVSEIADRITVLRNAKRVGTWSTAALTRPALIEAMTGREIEATGLGTHAAKAVDDAVLEFTGLGRAGFGPVSGRAARGETLGLAGLVGSGRTELARMLFGADAPERGQVRVGANSVRTGSIVDAISHGIAFTPEDRKGQGLVLDLSVLENIVLALQAKRGPWQPLGRVEQSRLAQHYISALKIKAPNPDTPVRSLSGGNQQKVLLARWLAMQPAVLILDEPTKGIDIGARAEIETLVTELRTKGLAVVLISSEFDEIVRVCGRVLVLRDGQSAGELNGPDVTEGRILDLIARGAAKVESA
jgi:monosaccharide-transporting ATPase